MTTEQMETLRKEFDEWLKQFEKPNEYNRMYGHHFNSFKAGYSCANSKLQQSEAKLEAARKVIDCMPQIGTYPEDFHDRILRLLNETTPKENLTSGETGK